MTRRLLLLFFLTYACALNAQDLYELDEIEFNGNNIFSASVLKEIIFSQQTPPWYWKFLNSFTSLGTPPQYFDSTKIPVDIGALKDFYNDKGFFKTQLKYHYEVDTAAKSVHLTYLITENQASQYGRAKLIFKTDIPVFLQDKLYNDLDLDSTYRYDQEKLESEIKKSIAQLTNNGFMLAKFDSTIISRDTLKNRADISIFIDPGKRYTISEVRIEKTGPGSQYVTDNLLREVTAIQPGEFYSREKISRSQTRLFRTGLFNFVSLSGIVEDSLENKVPLKLMGSIDKMNELAPEIVMDNEGNSFNLGLGASYIRKNFFGDARKFTLSTKFGIIDIVNFNFANIFKKPQERDSTFQGYIDVSAKVEQPYMFNKPIFGSLEFYTQFFTILRNTLRTVGGKLLFDFELPEYTFISLLQPYYNIEFLDYIPFVESSQFNLNINSTTSSIGTETGRSRVDDILFPTTGYNSTLLAEMSVSNTGTLISGNVTDTLSVKPSQNATAYFYKIQSTNAVYFPLNYRKTLVLGAKFKVGYIQTIKGSENLIPPNRTFYAGGSNSVRGWRARELTPKDSIQYYGITLSTNTGDYLLGGTFLMEGSFEYRIRFLQSYGLVLFGDYGNVWNGYKNIRIDEIAVAAGIGFRYFSSIAPFRFDFGFKFYNPADKKFIFHKPFFKQMEFHFAIGEAF